MKSIAEKKNEDGSVTHLAVINRGGAHTVSSLATAKEAREFFGIPEPTPMPVIDGKKRRLHVLRLHGLAYETCGRAGELLKARWEDYDLAGRTWMIPAANNKNRRARVVPLTAEAVRLLIAMQPLADPSNPRVFHALASAACSPKAFHAVMLQMGLPCRNFIELRRLAIKCLESRSLLTEVEICQIVDRPLSLPPMKGRKAYILPTGPRA